MSEKDKDNDNEVMSDSAAAAAAAAAVAAVADADGAVAETVAGIDVAAVADAAVADAAVAVAVADTAVASAVASVDEDAVASAVAAAVGAENDSVPDTSNTKNKDKNDDNKTTAVASTKATPSEATAASYPNYGQALHVEVSGNRPFPYSGSTLGSWYCLGTLGKGTFSSIHKVINLDYFYGKKEDQRVAAAKVELSDFANSGVLLGEAVLLHFLHHSLKDHRVVPMYLGHYKQRPAQGQQQQQQQSNNEKNKTDDDMEESSANEQTTSVAQPLPATTAALVMEYLQGDDMHQIREKYGVGPAKRRLAVQDAVHLTARVLLPLIQQMHRVGLVHRDVKPSNCVRKSTTSKDFLLVDFGLSKSLIVPKDSTQATKHEWPDNRPWLRPPVPTNSNNNKTEERANKTKLDQQPQKGCIREERLLADFRGTSMYASLRVHQGKDYSRRDDMWSLLYVFCDLVSGGLPWMSHAANRDRDACRYIKERVHGLGKKDSDNSANGLDNNDDKPNDETEELLKGDEYFVAKYKAEKSTGNVKVPEPLPLSKDELKVQLLRQAFQHLARLSFYDEPDYAFIQNCILRFLDNLESDPTTTPIDWDILTSSGDNSSNKKRKRSTNTADDGPNKDNNNNDMDVDDDNDNKDDDDDAVYYWDLIDEPDPLGNDIFRDSHGNTYDNDDEQNPMVPRGDNEDDEDDPNNSLHDNHDGENNANSSHDEFKRLPMQIRFFITQMDHHVKKMDSDKNNNDYGIKRIILRDWMKIAIPLLYEEWDSQKYEYGGHRTNKDGYRRESYIDLIQRCIKWAESFNYFGHPDYYYDSKKNNDKDDDSSPISKKRNIICNLPKPAGVSKNAMDLIGVSRVIFGLKCALKAEQSKNFAPPPMISFGAR